MEFRFLFILFTGVLLLLFVRDLVLAVQQGRIRQFTRRERVLAAVSAAGVLNFLAFIFVDALLGGDALGGHARDGHYFLGNHGIYTEVSRATFVYSACHAYSGMMGLIAAFASAQELKRRSWWPRKNNA